MLPLNIKNVFMLIFLLSAIAVKPFTITVMC